MNSVVTKPTVAAIIAKVYFVNTAIVISFITIKSWLKQGHPNQEHCQVTTGRQPRQYFMNFRLIATSTSFSTHPLSIVAHIAKTIVNYWQGLYFNLKNYQL